MRVKEGTEDTPLLPGMNILTPEFKREIDALTGEDTQQFIVTPAHSGVTVEEAQAEALRWVRDELEGRCVVTDHFPDPVKKRTLDEFLQENRT